MIKDLDKSSTKICSTAHHRNFASSKHPKYTQGLPLQDNKHVRAKLFICINSLKRVKVIIKAVWVSELRSVQCHVLRVSERIFLFCCWWLSTMGEIIKVMFYWFCRYKAASSISETVGFIFLSIREQKTKTLKEAGQIILECVTYV